MRKRGFLCLLSATFVLTACSTTNGNDVKPTTTDSAPSSVSNSPSSAPSTTPTHSSGTSTPSSDTTTPASGAASEKSAVAFVEFFSRQANLAYQTNRPELFAGLYIATCKTCAAMKDQVNEYKGLGQRYEGEVVHPTSTTISNYTDGKSAKVFVSSSTAAVNVVDASGAVVKTFPASTGGLVFTLDFADGWRVASIQASS